jgi:hypothetical protein
MLPTTIRVKLSSENAEAISLTPVVVQELQVGELLRHVLSVTGKDEPRIRDLLLRGTLVSGASRFRWAGFEADADSLHQALAAFPDPDPTIPFDAARCTRAVLRGGRQAIELPRDAISRRTLFRRQTFWDLLMEVVSAASPRYAGYSYREGTDRYTRPLTVAETTRLREGCGTVPYTTVREQIRSVAFVEAELFATR